jgi:Pyocin activator protein PrtN
MNTHFLLMAQYNGAAVIPVERVCTDYFSPLTTRKFLEYIACGRIRLPLVRLYPDAKSAKGVHLADLAAYIDERRKAALKECRQMHQ